MYLTMSMDTPVNQQPGVQGIGVQWRGMSTAPDDVDGALHAEVQELSFFL